MAHAIAGLGGNAITVPAIPAPSTYEKRKIDPWLAMETPLTHGGKVYPPGLLAYDGTDANRSTFGEPFLKGAWDYDIRYRSRPQAIPQTYGMRPPTGTGRKETRGLATTVATDNPHLPLPDNYSTKRSGGPLLPYT